MDNNDELNNKQQEVNDASKKTAHVGLKTAADTVLPGAGGKIYDVASRLKPVQDVENNLGRKLQQVPGANGMMNIANKTGALDALDEEEGLGKDNLEGLPQKDESLAKSSSLTDESKAASSISRSNDNTSRLDNSVDNVDNKENNSIFSLGGNNFFNNKKIIIISSLASFIFFFIIIIAAAASAMGPVDNAEEFVKRLWNGTSYFFTYFSFDGFLSSQEQEKAYYEKLYEVQKEWHDKGICIDINLITSSLTAGRTFDEVLDSINNLDGEDEEQSTDEYAQMKKRIEVLARMQIKKVIYEEKIVDGSKCVGVGQATDTSLVNEGEHDSSTPELVASHDANGLEAFFKKKADEEQNKEYHVYRPPLTYVTDTDGNIQYDSNGSAIVQCNVSLPQDSYELDIGDYSTMKDSVFYWNLVNQFIPDYYSEYLPDEEEARKNKIEEIAEEIYLLYDQMGPSQSCGFKYTGPSNLCTNGITIEDVGTLDFEEYIAGVVSNEAYTSEGMEALKAQAIAARTYALNYTNYCEKVIPNSTNAQTFTRDINDRARQAVGETKGMILTYDGNIFSSQYDSFCYDDSDCPDSTKNSDGTYSVTYTKMPNGETHKIVLSDSSQFGRITNGQGHAHGMSQLLSYQMAKEGRTYEEILKYFYSDGVEIKVTAAPVIITADASIIRGPITDYLTDSILFNQNIFNKVKNAGLSTSNGVAAAASALVSDFYNQTGLKLPYELTPSGKYSGYGIDTSWGTSTGDRNYPLNGLDCSGFVSWAIHNGGFNYEVKSAFGWGDAGVKREWKTGTTDSNAKPGDLIYNKPQSNNGTTGHIRMIVAVGNDGYVVAEASSGKNGIRTTNISFTSTGNYYLVDMSGYYQNATKVTDYPS